jgi:hypothetical protein
MVFGWPLCLRVASAEWKSLAGDRFWPGDGSAGVVLGAAIAALSSSLCLKEHSATAHASHLLDATVQFLTELLVIETTGPEMRRVRDSDVYDVSLLQFGLLSP